MPALASDAVRWDQRIARARALAPAHPAAKEALTFYAALAEYQKTLLTPGVAQGFLTADALAKAVSPAPATPGNDIRILDLIPDFLAWLPQVAPAPFADSVVEMRQCDRARWHELVRAYLAGDGDVTAPSRFVIEALLQPFAEHSALRNGLARVDRTSPRCPHCGGLPVLGVLREEGHGARRTLVCGLCLTEHEYLRVVCPACGEQEFELLPVYSADRFDHVRIDACDRCRRYLKTIDLSKDGLAVPTVDDIASLSLDVWARERGYDRLRSNVIGL